MPAVPVSLLEPVWAQFSVLLPEHPVVDPAHPLGRHRRRIPDRIVFEHVVAALVHGSGYERIATPGCSDRTIRRRLHTWAAAGLADTLHTLVLAQYDHLIGLDYTVLVVDGCITKAPVAVTKAANRPLIGANRDSNARRSPMPPGCRSTLSRPPPMCMTPSSWPPP